MDTTRLSLLDQVCIDPTDERWTEFATLYTPFIEGFLVNQGVYHQDVADIRQEVLQVLLRELRQFTHNQRKGAFRKWLRQVVANRLRSHRRASKKCHGRGGDTFDWIADQLLSEDSELSGLWNLEHDRHVLNGLFNAITPRFTQQTLRAFQLVVLDEMPPVQVAQMLKISVNAVRIAQARVLKSLRQVGKGLVD